MAYEDFKNDYTEVDPATYINADTADTRANYVDMDLDIDAYFHKDFTASHFTNFTHLIDIHVFSAGLTVNRSNVGFAVGTTVDDMDDQTDAFQLRIRARTVGGGNTDMSIRDASDSGVDNSVISLDTTYYLKCIRNGTAWSIEIYDAAERGGGDLLDTVALTGTATAFRYVLAAQSNNLSTGGRAMSGYFENLDLQEAAAPSGIIQHVAYMLSRKRIVGSGGSGAFILFDMAKLKQKIREIKKWFENLFKEKLWRYQCALIPQATY